MTGVEGQRVRQFRLPDLGEGLTEGEILRWLVQPGDTVLVNQPLVEVETAKAAVEVPSPYAGVVTALHHPAGAMVDVGSAIISVDTDPDAGPLPPAARSSPPAGTGVGQSERTGAGRPVAAGAAAGGTAGGGTAAGGTTAGGTTADGAAAHGATAGGTTADGAAATEAPGGRTAVLVGYGPRTGSAVRRARRRPAQSPAAASPPQPEDTAGPAGAGRDAVDALDAAGPPPAPARVSAAAVGHAAAVRVGGAPAVGDRIGGDRIGGDRIGGDRIGGDQADTSPVLGDARAKPPVRRLARSLGVDLAGVLGTGSGGVVTRDDVERAVQQVAGASSYAGSDRETRVPVRGVRRATAAAMVLSAQTAPHVTEFLTLDITASMQWRQRLAAAPELAGVKVTPLLPVARALLLAVARNPEVNAAWDDAAQEIVVKHYVHLGIATATPRGLLVPVIRDADGLTLPRLAHALRDVAETARSGRSTPAQLSGGTITITNVGPYGVDNGTPILVPGQSAILCLGAIRPMPWVVEGAVVVRQVTQLALSFDHRVIDGQLGSQLLSDIARVLQDPMAGLLW